MSSEERALGSDVLVGGRAGAGATRPYCRSANLTLLLGVLGVGLGFLLMFAVLTPAAIVAGVRALREIRAEPALAGRARAWTGIALALVAPVLWVGLFVGLLADGVIS